MPLIKLTRLNRSTVAVNPDHIAWIDAAPDTTLCLIGGDKLIVRESLDELVDKVIDFRRLVRLVPSAEVREDLAMTEGDLLPEDVVRAIRRGSTLPGARPPTRPPHSERKGG